MKNSENEIYKILKNKYLKGPRLDMNSDLIGLNSFSGDKNSAFYELYGKNKIFKMLIFRPSSSLFINSYLGKNHFLILLVEDEGVKGGFITNENWNLDQFGKIFTDLDEKDLNELFELCKKYLIDHFNELNQ